MAFRIVCSIGLGWLLLPAFTNARLADEKATEASAKTKQADKQPDVAMVVQAIIRCTNDFRKAEDQKAVEVNPKLTQAAQAFADFMARTDKYGHEADGKSPAERATLHEYEHCIISENIAYRFSSTGFKSEELAQGFFKGWQDSPGHRKNMLDADVTETGVAVAQSKETGNYYAVQMFGRPKSLTIEFKITNNLKSELSYTIADRTFTLPPRHTRTHQECRQPELRFSFSDGEKAAVTEKTYRPTNGAEYVVCADTSGAPIVDKK